MTLQQLNSLKIGDKVTHKWLNEQEIYKVVSIRISKSYGKDIILKNIDEKKAFPFRYLNRYSINAFKVHKIIG